MPQRYETPKSSRISSPETSARNIDHRLTDTELSGDVDTLATLGSETRYEALRLIAAADGGGVCGCELQSSLAVSQGAVSQALSRLHDAGFLTRHKEGRWRFYDTTDRAERLLAVLDEIRVEEDE